MTWYWAGWWTVVVVGVAAAGGFLVTWRPSQRLSWRTMDASWWVAVILALYLWAAVRVVLGHASDPDGPFEAAVLLTLGILIDSALVLRALRWWQFRRDDRTPPEPRE